MIFQLLRPLPSLESNNNKVREKGAARPSPSLFHLEKLQIRSIPFGRPPSKQHIFLLVLTSLFVQYFQFEISVVLSSFFCLFRVRLFIWRKKHYIFVENFCAHTVKQIWERNI